MRLAAIRRLALCAVFAALAAAAAPLFAAPSAEVKAAEDELRKAINASDLDGADRAIAQLRQIGGKDAVKVILVMAQKMPAGAEGAYWRLVNGAAGFRDDAGLEEVGDSVLSLKGAPISRDLMFALANNRLARVATVVYAPILDKGSEEFRLMAADNICGIEYVEAVDVIIAQLRKDEKKKGEVYNRLLAGVKWLTGADCGTADAWDAWWKGGGRAAGLKGREKRETGTGTVVDDAEGPRIEEIVGLGKISPEKIIVLVADCPKGRNGDKACNYDDMDRLLTEMKVPHKVVKKSDFESGKATLDKAMALLLTCTQNNDHCVCPKCIPGTTAAGNRMVQCTGCDKHEIANHKLSSNAVKKLKEWVERGGYLFSEDWGLKDAVEPAWPTYVKQGKMMKERKVPVSPTRGRTSHPLLRGVFIDPAAKPQPVEGGEGGGTVERTPPSMEGVKIERIWTIDADSPYIDVANKQNVVTLMESDTLGREGFPAVAVTFLPTSGAQGEGKATTGLSEKIVGGRVLHVLSHFGKQQNREDEFALQQLLLNFLMEANKRQGKKSA